MTPGQLTAGGAARQRQRFTAAERPEAGQEEFRPQDAAYCQVYDLF